MSGENTVETTQQTSQTTPWGPSAGILQGLLKNVGGINPSLTGTENSALSGLLGNAGFLNQFGGAATGLAQSLFGGGPDRTGMVNEAYQNYRSQLAPTAGGQFLDPSSNPFYSQLADDITKRTQGAVNAMYAGAGRDPAGAGSYGGVLGRSIAEGLAPTAAGIYNTERGRQLDAISGMYGAGGQTAGLLSGLDQTRFGNQLQGLGAATAAQGFANDPFNQMLAVEAQRRGIPLQTLAAQLGLVLPVGQAFGTTTGTATKETDVPTLDKMLGYAAMAAGTAGKFYGGGK
jgi:hypothetical protein